MILSLIAMDLVWILGLVLVATPAASAAYAVFVQVAAEGDPLRVGLGMALAFTTFVAVYIAVVLFVLLVLPAPKPGRYPVLKGRSFFLWAVGLVVRRWLDVAPIGTLLRQSAIGRLAYLRCGGARVHPSVNMSSDVLILDPAGFEIGEGSMLGLATMVSGHMVMGGELTIAPVVIGRGVETGSSVGIALGVQIGDRVQIAPAALVGPFARIEDDARIGTRATIGPYAIVGKRARVEPHAFVPPGTKIADGGVFPPVK